MGDAAEDIVERWLRAQGWVIEARNVQYRCGELDIVALDGVQRVFVEVRSGRDVGIRPEDTVTRRKRQRLERAAWLYLQRGVRSASERRRACRFDVIAVHSRELRVLRHHRSAFAAGSRGGRGAAG